MVAALRRTGTQCFSAEIYDWGKRGAGGQSQPVAATKANNQHESSVLNMDSDSFLARNER